MLFCFLDLSSENVSIVLLIPIKYVIKLPLWVVKGYGVDLVEQIDADEDRLLTKPEFLEKVRVVEPVLKKCAEQSHVDDVKNRYYIDISFGPMAELVAQNGKDLFLFALVMLEQLLCQVDVQAVDRSVGMKVSTTIFCKHYLVLWIRIP